MKRKYLIYTLFALLAANMSWNFERAQSIQLASSSGEIEVRLGDDRFFLQKGEESERTIVTSSGQEETKSITNYSVLRVEGTLCETCFIGEDIVAEGNSELPSALQALIDKIEEEKREEERQERLAQQREEREEREERRKNCDFSDQEDEVECLNDRIADIRSDLRDSDLDREEKKELEEDYAEFMDRISFIAESYLEDQAGYQNEIYALEKDLTVYQQYLRRAQQEAQQADQMARFQPTRENIDRARMARQNLRDYKDQAKSIEREIKSLERNHKSVERNFEDFEDLIDDRAVERTLKALKRSERAYTNYSEGYHRVAEYRTLGQLDPINRIQYDMAANQLEKQLESQRHYAEINMERQLDRNYKGGLSRTNIDSYLSRYDEISRQVEMSIQDSLNGNALQSSNLRNNNISPVSNPGPVRGTLDLSRLNSNRRFDGNQRTTSITRSGNDGYVRM